MPKVNLGKRPPRDQYGMTALDREIITRLCQGKTQDEIAKEVFVSQVGVSWRIKTVVEKNECRNSVQLIHKLTKEGAI